MSLLSLQAIFFLTFLLMTLGLMIMSVGNGQLFFNFTTHTPQTPPLTVFSDYYRCRYHDHSYCAHRQCLTKGPSCRNCRCAHLTNIAISPFILTYIHSFLPLPLPRFCSRCLPWEHPRTEPTPEVIARAPIRPRSRHRRRCGTYDPLVPMKTCPHVLLFFN